MKKQLFVILALLTIAAIFLTACQPSSPSAQPTEEKPAEQPAEAPKEELLIVYVTPLLSMSPDWSRSHDAFLEAAKEFGFEGRVVGPNEINIEQMVADIETAIAEGADAIITCPLVPDAFEAVFQSAKDKGIPIVNVMADGSPDKRLTFIGTDPVALGKAYAEKIIEDSNGKANIGVIMTDATTPNQKTELDNFTEALKAYPDLKIVDTQYDHSQVSEAVEKSAAMLTAHPEIDYLVCLEGACPNGVGKTVEEMKLAGKVKVLAIDLQPGTIDYIKSGVIWGSFTQGFYDPAGGGRTAAQVLVDYLRNGTKPPDFIDSGYSWWTVENVDQYGQPAGAAEEKPAEVVDLSSKKVVYVTPLLSMSPDWSRSHEDFLQAAKKLGFQAKVVGPNEINIEQMVADIETAIAEDVDAIITCPLVPDAFEDVLQKAKDKGIPVINAMADCCSDKRITFIGTDPVALGKAYAEKIIEDSGGQANIGVIMTDATTPNQKIELDNFTDALTGYPDIKIVDTQYDHSQVSEAVEKSAAMLTAHSEIDYVVCLEGACPNGVGKTVEEMNLAGEVKVLAIDLQPGTIDYIKSGVIWGSFTQGFFNFNGGGAQMAQILVDYWNGTAPADFVDSGYDWWTIENVDQYGK